MLTPSLNRRRPSSDQSDSANRLRHLQEQNIQYKRTLKEVMVLLIYTIKYESQTDVRGRNTSGRGLEHAHHV